MEKVVIEQQRGKRSHSWHHGKGTHSAAAWKIVIAQQRGKGKHSGASWKNVEKVVIALHRGKTSHSGAAWKK